MPTHLYAFAAIAFVLVVTPGPNMIYLVSRSICQGRSAGLISLAGVAAAFVVYLTFTVLGVTALATRVPAAFEILRIAGAAYLVYLAWQVLRPGGRSPFEVRKLRSDSPLKLFTMGFFTNLLNPKAAMLYVSLLPQFIEPARGHVLQQSLALGATQIGISLSINALIVVTAGAVAGLLARHPRWATAQRWIMGTVLGSLAVRMALDGRR